MDKNSKQYESLKNKLKKLQALAERGYKGEAENARRVIENLCKQYGVNIEDVLDFETKRSYRFDIGRKTVMMNLFIRCISAVVSDIDGKTYWKPSRSIIEVDGLTALEYADTLSLFNWHKANFEKELEEFNSSFMSAYIGKHDLYFDKERTGCDDTELTKADIERIRRVWKMREAMSDNTYHKQLEAKQ